MEIQFIKNKKPKRRKARIERVKVKKGTHSRTSKIIIGFVIVSLFTFTGLAMFVQIRSNVELSPTLTTCFYAFCTGELWMLASIKKTKLNNGEKNYQYSEKLDNITINENDEGNKEEINNDEEPKG